jgi:hypothetical protein
MGLHESEAINMIDSSDFLLAAIVRLHPGKKRPS